MNIKPSDFFIGVIDFFSIVLPGALVTYFLMGMFYDEIFGAGKIFLLPSDGAVQWIVFLFSTYIIGNIIFMLASKLDDLYDKFIRKLFVKNHSLEVKVANYIQEGFINTDYWITQLNSSGRLSNSEIKEIYSKDSRYIFNTFKWSQHYLLFNNPEAYSEVKRIEADSKFFRSLVIAFLTIGILLLLCNYEVINYSYDLHYGWIFFILAFLSFYRFAQLMYKATLCAYELVITHFQLKPKTEKEKIAKISTKILRKSPSKEFLRKHKKIMDFLMKGINQEPMQVSINPNELQNITFEQDTNQIWYCIEGRGMIQKNGNEGQNEIFLIPNSIIPVSRESSYLFINKRNEPIEFLVINNN